MRKGFTLIELLIVIAVISILIGIALPRFKGMQQEGWTAQAKGELRTLQNAVESYNIHNGSYPADQDAFDLLPSESVQIVGAMPTDPFDSGSSYAYFNNGDYYVISSAGVNGTNAVSGIGATGTVAGADTDDIWVSNGPTQKSW